jgi:multiple sugar transport system substrate-binding protein
MRLKLSGCLLLILIIIIPVSLAYAELTLWLMPNEPSVLERPSPEKWEVFLDKNNILNNPQLLQTDPNFACQIFNQRVILQRKRKYKTNNPSVGEIQIEFVKWTEAFNKIESMANDVNEGPDIAELGTTWTAYFGNKGVLVDLRKYVDQNLYHHQFIERCKVVGSNKLYGLPWFNDPWILVYWKRTIDNPERDLRDWEHFERTCASIQRRIEDGELEGMRFACGIPTQQDWNILHLLAIWIWSAGGEIIHVSPHKLYSHVSAVLHEEKAVDGVNFIARLVKAGYIDLPEITLPLITEDFINGKYAMIFTGPWIIKQLGEGWKESFGITEVPRGPGGRYTFCGGANLGILKIAEKRGNLDKAIGLIKYICSPDSQLLHAEITGSLPTTKEGLKEYINRYDFCKVFRKAALENSKAYKNIPEFAPLVENKITWRNIHSLWRQIAEHKPIRILRQTLKSTSDEINNNIARLYIHWYKVGILALIIIIVIVVIYGLKKIKSPPPPPPPPPSTHYSVTIYLKDTPLGTDQSEWIKDETFLNMLLNPDNVRIEIKKDEEILTDSAEKNLEPKEIIIFNFIAFKTFRRLPTSSTEMSSTGSAVIEALKEYCNYSSQLKQLSDSTIRIWISNIRKKLSVIGAEDLIPKQEKLGRGKGFKINGNIVFVKETEKSSLS